MNNRQVTNTTDVHENKLVRREMTFVVILNLIIFAAMLGVYFWDRSAGVVEDFFMRLIRF